MGIIDKFFSKKADTSSEKLEVLPQSEAGYLVEAEQMANIVVAGLENDNYSDMNRQLSNMISNDDGKVNYVFEHPSIISTLITMTVCFAAILFNLYFLFIFSSTVFFSTEYFTIGAMGAGVSFAVLVVDAFLISKFISALKYKTRFDVYFELLRFKSLEFIEDLAICSKQKEATVIKDLHRAIKQNLIPQGHFSRDSLVFMVSNKIYDKYIEKPAVYDRYFQNKLEERQRVKSRTKRISEIMETGEQYIKKLIDFKTLVRDKLVERKIERLENIVSMIFHEIDVSPTQAKSLGVFLNYYLPTTEKLLDTYVSIEEKKLTDPNLSAAKKEIEEALNTINVSFEGILEKLYEEYEMDISSDIAAMEMVMKKEGLSG